MSCLSPGQLIKLYCDWLEKPKYFLAVSISDGPWLFWISSNKPAFCSSNPEIDADFLILPKEEYPFLDHNSWLDCGEVCRKFTVQNIEYQFRNRMGWKCGEISSDTKTKIIQAVGNSVRLSTIHQRIISENFST